MSVEASATNPGPSRFKIAVALIMVLAALLRFYGQDWDDGHYFHPDERFIATVMDDRLSLPAVSELGSLFDPATSPLNTRSDNEAGDPQAFAYGSLPFLVATVLGSVIGALSDTDLLTYQNVGEFGRFLTALVDLGTVALVMLFARQAFSELAAIIAGLLTAASVVLIQLSHFFTVDTWVTFFTMATLYACLHIARHFELRWILSAGALGGAALATKLSVGVLGIPILVAMLIGVLRTTRDRRRAARMYAIRLALAAIPTAVAFLIFEPYAVWRPGPFIDDIRQQWEIVNGHFDIPFTRQFVGTISGLNEIENLVLWGVAPGFGIAALIATGVGLYLAIRRRDPRYLVLMSWIIPYFYVIASSEARFLRYAAPLVPPLAIIVGHQLSSWWYFSAATWKARAAPAGAIGLVTGVTLVWAVMFMTVYAGTHPRIDASEWIYQNVEPGSTITHEIWDDRLPLRLNVGSGEVYEHRGLDLYSDRTNEEAVDFLVDVLHEVDYIVLASQRLSHSIPRLPWRYPVQSEYYRLLEQEKLGFELAYEATNYPGFGSFRINTLAADESFSVYDHPPVRIFRKVQQLPADEIELRFAHAAAQPRISGRTPVTPTLRLDQPVSERSGNATFEWSSQLSGSAPVAVVFWLLSLAVLTVAAIPVTTKVFGRFADSGLGFSTLFGLLGTGSIAWLIWSFELARFHVWLVIGSVLIFGFANWRFIGAPVDLVERLRKDRLIITGSAIALGAGFAVFLLLRAMNPDLWHPFYGGEKPMETAYLNAIAQTGEFPPHDPWFSDGTINYYYYGFFLLAMLWNLTGIPADIAFQLSLATVGGVLASGLFSLGSTLARSVLHTRNPRWLAAGGATSVLIVMFTGNLDAIRQVVRNRSTDVDFWASSRAVEFGISEFPYFSLLYADVHPHLIAAPMLVLVVATGYAWILASRRVDRTWIVLWAALAAIAAGSATATNLWDGPTAAIILLASLVFPLLRSNDALRARVLLTATVGLAVAVAGFGVFARFHRAFSPQTDGLEITSSGSALSESGIHFGGLLLPILLVAGISAYRAGVSGRIQFGFAAFGAILATGSFLAGAFVADDLAAGPIEFVVAGFALAGASAVITQAAGRVRNGRSQDVALTFIAPFIAISGGLALSRPVAAVSSIMVAAFLAFFFANRNRSSALLLTVSGASAAGLVLVADLVFVADHLVGSDWERMNTIFKLYVQSWTLLGIVAASATIWLIHRAWFRISVHGSGSPVTMGALAAGAIVFAGVLLAYPLLATPDRLDRRMESTPSFPSLAGYSWMNGGAIQNTAGEEIRFTGDYAAIDWLKRETEEIPVILEASIGAYRGGGSRFSSATGFPTPLGWQSHQSQQRDGFEVSERATDVRELYQSTDIERKRYLLRKLAVDYVVVGDVERYTIVGDVPDDGEPDYYSSPEGLDAFQQMVGDDLEIVFEDETVIYRVLPFETVGQGS